MKTLCLVVGHCNRYAGAQSATVPPVREFDWNSVLATRIEDYMVQSGKVRVVRVWRPDNNNIATLIQRVNATKADYYVELHANAFNKIASGTETLYWHTSSQGKRLATAIQRACVTILGMPDRGIKARFPKDRGAFQLSKTNPVAIITEPFFIDTPRDLANATAKREALAIAIGQAIEHVANPRANP